MHMIIKEDQDSINTLESTTEEDKYKQNQESISSFILLFDLAIETKAYSSEKY